MKHAILHCAAVPSGWAENHTAVTAAKEIDRWHREKGSRCIGYHFVVMPSGEVALGRPLLHTGAHTLGHNQGTVGILMIETKKAIKPDGLFEDHFTEAQRLVVSGIIAALRSQFPKIEVAGHNQFAPRICPAFKVVSRDWLPREPFK